MTSRSRPRRAPRPSHRAEGTESAQAPCCQCFRRGRQLRGCRMNPIALRYVTEVEPCPEANSPKLNVRSATPNARLAIERAVMPNRQHLLSATDGQPTAWHEALPDSLRDTATGAALQAIVDQDLDELISIEPPRGFGRD